METDRALLELAAKAAGLKVVGTMYRSNGLVIRGLRRSWNPLTDDGDALRLATKLELAIQMIVGIVIVTNIRTGEEFHEASFREDEFYGKVRLAIVRAAAAIGRAK